uniref:ARAD1D12012p n=1 Tax=Blastobotrys adeninivorans TaxID=409370 RepID=A0A060T8J8_BLAAD
MDKQQVTYVESEDHDHGRDPDSDDHEVRLEKDHPEAVPLGMNEEMYNAVYGEDSPSLWARGHIKLYMICTVLYFMSSMSGYDGAVMSSINVMQTYLDHFGMKSAGSSTGLVFSIANIASISVALFVWVADYFGRKPVIVAGIVGTLVGTVVVCTANTTDVFIGGRFLLFFSSGIAYVSIPLYLVEISPPNIRGALAGLFNTFNFCGTTVATLTSYGCYINYPYPDPLQFKIPLWLQMLCPGISFLGIMFCPESPRWLLAHGKPEKARKILTELHANGVENHPIVEIQMAEMHAELENNPISSFKEYFNIWDLVNSRSKRYRMFLATTWSWFGNFTGSQVISYYLPTMLSNLGVGSTEMTLLLNAIYAIAQWVFAVAGAFMHDIVGRRKMMLMATAGIVVCFSCVAIGASQYEKTGSEPSSVASIVFIYIFGCIFASTYTSLQPIYPAEVLTTQMRAKGMAFYQAIFNVSGFILAYTGSMAMEKMGFWYYVFFAFWNAFVFCIIFMWYVETKGRSLEELEEVFQASNPKKASYEVKVRGPTNI